MNPAQVVIGKPEAQRRPVILPLLRDPKRESGKASNASSHAKILALDIRVQMRSGAGLSMSAASVEPEIWPCFGGLTIFGAPD